MRTIQSGTAKAAPLMEAERWDLKLLGDLARHGRRVDLHGQAAPNAIRCVTRFFEEQVEV